MNSDYTLPSLSIYVSPSAIISAPEYAKKLVEENGVDCFVLRTGFNPMSIDENTQKSMDIIKKLDVQCWLLVGTWWGEGIYNTNDMMLPIIKVERDFNMSNESIWKMRTPGGIADTEIKYALKNIISSLSPDAICLTHARYRHPADIEGMFEIGTGNFKEGLYNIGISEEKLRNGLIEVLNKINTLKPNDLYKIALGKTFPEFMDYLVEDNLFSKWFSYRSSIIWNSILEFKRAVYIYSNGNTLFGINSYGPTGAYLCGINYGEIDRNLDFVQPLLGYILWHTLQPIASIAKFLIENSSNLDDKIAIEIAKNFLNLTGIDLPETIQQLITNGEGSKYVVFDIVLREIMLLQSFKTHINLLPVLRGNDWDTDVALFLRKIVKECGYRGIVFQGTDLIGGKAPTSGWN